jgi:hypothetical protein
MSEPPKAGSTNEFLTTDPPSPKGYGVTSGAFRRFVRRESMRGSHESIKFKELSFKKEVLRSPVSPSSFCLSPSTFREPVPHWLPSRSIERRTILPWISGDPPPSKPRRLVSPKALRRRKAAYPLSIEFLRVFARGIGLLPDPCSLPGWRLRSVVVAPRGPGRRLAPGTLRQAGMKD